MSTPEIKLKPPDGSSADSADTKSERRWLWPFLLVLGVLGLSVIFVLPGLVKDNPGPKTGAQPSVKQGSIAAEATASREKPRERADRILQSLLQKRARLELARAEIWGEPEWSKATSLSATADRLYGQRHFDEAADDYDRALKMLESLDADRDARLDASVEAGLRALHEDQADVAQRQFELALAIAPDHDTATQGLEKARVRPEVLGRMAEGNQAETAGDLDWALAAYQEANVLDGSYEPARQAADQVSTRIEEIRYRDSMSLGLAALDQGRLQEATDALNRAAGLRPADAALIDARQRLDQARKLAALEAIRRQAAHRAKAEDWPAVVALYQRALRVDPNAGFALDGLKKAREHALLHERIDRYLAAPERLFADDPLADAERLLAAAGQAPASEPRLTKKLDTLRRQVSLARTPVPVTLHSDNQTQVVIYRLGRLGSFRERRLELRPGTYTAVGSRTGYRDVRRVFSIKPGVPPGPVQVVCEEPI